MKAINIPYDLTGGRSEVN